MTASAAGGGRSDSASVSTDPRTRAADPRGVLPTVVRSSQLVGAARFSSFSFFFFGHTDTQTAGGEVRA